MLEQTETVVHEQRHLGLEVGDEVWLQVKQRHAVSGTNDRFTSFTGFLLYPKLATDD